MASSDLREDSAVPFIAVLTSFEHDGDWNCRAEYPELPGCFVEARTALDAMDQLDDKRIWIIHSMHERGETPPRPRPPLLAELALLNAVSGSATE